MIYEEQKVRSPYLKDCGRCGCLIREDKLLCHSCFWENERSKTTKREEDEN